MKLYSDKPDSSISIIIDDKFSRIIEGIITKESIKYVFESGTYKGTGSTETLAKIFLESGNIPHNFTTVEANYDFYKEASQNLSKYPFINPVFGLSVDILEATKFLLNDDIYDHLEAFEDIYIDHRENPRLGYFKEITIGMFQDGFLGASLKNYTSPFKKKQRTPVKFKNNVFADFVKCFFKETALIILDSSAGIGLFEFREIIHLMKGRKFYLILDDIHHLKHFRSRRFIEQNSNDFEIISSNEEQGWLMAKVYANDE